MTDPLVDMDLERRYVAAVVNSGRVAPNAGPGALYDRRHAAIVSAALSLLGRGEECMPLSVEAELRRLGKLDLAGGAEYLAHVTTAGEWVPDLLGDCVAALHRRRNLRSSGLQLVAAANDGDEEAISSIIDSLGDAAQPRDLIRTQCILDAGTAWLQHLARQADDDQLRYGLPILDRRIGGFAPGSLHVVAGRSGCRKSSLLLFCALAMARRGRRIGIVSLEDPDVVWGERAARSEAPSGGLAEAMEAVPSLARLQIRIAYAIGERPSEVERACSLLLEGGSEVLLVDYAQAAEQEISTLRRTDALRQMVGRIKGLGSHHGVPVLLGSQITTEGGAALREPAANDVRDCKDIFNKAESLVLLWKESPEEGAPVLGRLAKCKTGGEGLRFQLEISPSGVVVGASPPSDASY